MVYSAWGVVPEKIRGAVDLRSMKQGLETDTSVAEYKLTDCRFISCPQTVHFKVGQTPLVVSARTTYAETLQRDLPASNEAVLQYGYVISLLFTVLPL